MSWYNPVKPNYGKEEEKRILPSQDNRTVHNGGFEVAYNPDAFINWATKEVPGWFSPNPTGDGGSKPSGLERFLRDTPLLNLLTTPIADQMSEDRFKHDSLSWFGLTEDDDYYPSRSGFNYGAKGALNILNGISSNYNTVSNAVGSATPYKIANSSNKMKQIYG